MSATYIVVLTAIAIINLCVIPTMALAVKAAKDRDQRTGGAIILMTMILDMLAAIGGVVLW